MAATSFLGYQMEAQQLRNYAAAAPATDLALVALLKELTTPTQSAAAPALAVHWYRQLRYDAAQVAVVADGEQLQVPKEGAAMGLAVTAGSGIVATGTVRDTGTETVVAV